MIIVSFFSTRYFGKNDATKSFSVAQKIMSKSLGFAARPIRNADIVLQSSKIANPKTLFDCGAMTHSNINLQCDVTVPSVHSPVVRDQTQLDRLWMYCVLLVSVCVSTFLFVYTLEKYEERKSYIVPSLIAVAVVIAITTWVRNMLSMNMFANSNANKARRSALILYFLSGACFLASSFAVMSNDSVTQFTSSLIGSVIGWQGFVVIFEGTYGVPSRQQLAALVQILILSGLWEIRTFVVNSHFV